MTIRLLVVDDDHLQLELVERALSRDGFEVRAVSALATLAAEARVFAPQLVLVDVNMPDAPADRTTALLRDAAPEAKLVLYSAWDDSKLRALALQLGADGFLSKSTSAVALGGKLRELYRGGT